MKLYPLYIFHQTKQITVYLRLFLDSEKWETEGFIHDLERWIHSRITDVSPYLSDTIEFMTIEYSYPNMLIDGWFKIPMVDFKALLEEWLAFIS